MNTFKIILIGESNVGKSNILNKFVNNKFMENEFTTLGLNYFSKLIKINNINYKLQLWDTAGQEKFYSITRNYYNNSDGIILCFDITKELTFNSLDNWFKKIHENNIKNVELILVGTKKDLDANREVNKNVAIDFANELKIDYIEVSSKTGNNINELFFKLVSNIIDSEKNKNTTINCNNFILKDIENKYCC
jgi:small GTP-binding protein